MIKETPMGLNQNCGIRELYCSRFELLHSVDGLGQQTPAVIRIKRKIRSDLSELDSYEVRTENIDCVNLHRVKDSMRQVGTYPDRSVGSVVDVLTSKNTGNAIEILCVKLFDGYGVYMK